LLKNKPTFELKKLFRNNRIKFFLLAFLFFAIGYAQKAKATHLRAGEIIVERINCQELTFRIKIVAYTDCEPANPVLFGEGILTFGDGSDPDGDGEPGILLPQIPNQERADLGDGVCTAQFVWDHTFASQGVYKIGYVEPNRNADVLNISNSVDTQFYVETEISIDPLAGCNNSPELLIPPIDKACTGVAFFHNPGAFDPDGDSISFELVVPKMNRGLEVNGYLPLNDPVFYSNPNQGNENQSGPPEFEIDPISGEVTWDSPGLQGEYNIAFIVREWREINGQYFPIGFVTRDMQIIVEDCDNERPILEVPEDLCVEAGTLIDETIFGTDPDNDDVEIEVFSQVLDLGATFGPTGPQPSVPPAEVNFTWQTECIDIRQQPYKIDVKITDFPEEGVQLVDFETFFITVVGPSPDVTTITQDGQALLLNWDDYACQNADNIQVWRRVDSNPFDPDECETGMRENSGYSLIDNVDVTETTYRDTNLDAAAKYCYRLIATFPDPTGGESIVSDEICFEFVPAEEPIITHVSVRQTDDAEGQVSITWREPFELGNLVAPYTFKVYRAEGFSGDVGLTEIAEVVTSATDSASLTVVDAGINTADDVYNYRVSIIDPTGSNGDEEIFSSTASTVRLAPTSLDRKIKIDWSAQVPWSNNIPVPPGSEHLIYRGLEGTADEDLQLLARVDVSKFGFSYTDSVNIEDDEVYCYRVLTKGTYGNPAIQGPGLDPLLNFSQVVCTQASDTIPPCAPVVSIVGPQCEINAANFCNANQNYRNIISWTTEFIGECQDDVERYEVQFSEQLGGEFQVIAIVEDTTFIHQKNDSFKGCYRVVPIDRSGNLGDPSEVFCVDNCPNYELPNVLTINDDNCNETFRAFGAPESNCPEGSGFDPLSCARFVNSVKFTVYNRWGSEVYSYIGQQGSENDIYINWDGTNDNGTDLSAGVYYYLAEVEFDVVDPANAIEEIKGWIQVIR